MDDPLVYATVNHGVRHDSPHGLTYGRCHGFTMEQTTTCPMVRVRVRSWLFLWNAPWDTPHTLVFHGLHHGVHHEVHYAVGYSMVCTMDVHGICRDVMAFTTVNRMVVGCPMNPPVEYSINRP